MAALSTLRTSTRRLINETDSANTNYSDSELTDYLNQATMFLGTEMEWSIQTSQATSVLNQALYSLPADFISLTELYFNNRKLIILEREDLTDINATWQDAPSGTPQYAYKADNAVFGLYPAPDSVQAGYTIQIQYISLPATLSDNADIPDLHTAFQMCLPFYAAFLCEHRAGNDKKSDLNLKRFDQHRIALMSKVQRFSDDTFRFRWPSR